MNYSIFGPEELIEEGLVEVPLSKSVANRALVLAAMTPDAPSPVCPDCADTAVMRRALDALAGAGSDEVEINVDNCGTAMRFLTAFVAAREGCHAVLSGSGRMAERPIEPLVTALKACGADIEYLGREGYPPLRVSGRRLRGGEVTVDATVSSQFVSALLMAAPLMEQGLTVNLSGEPVSAPYISLTLSMMDRRGIAAERSPLSVSVAPGSYRAPSADDAEGDWSAAAFFYEITALTAGWITVRGLDAASLQGDARAVNYFAQLGVVTEPSESEPGAIELQPSPEVFGRLDLGLSDTPDMAPALAVCAALLGVPFRLTGLKGLAIKECDRLHAIAAELDKVGCSCELIRDYGIEWDGRRHPVAAFPVFDPRGDHRLAMALAPAAVYIPGAVVCDVECVDKSFPGYWDALRSLGFTLRECVVSPQGHITAPDGSPLVPPGEEGDAL